MSTAVSAAQAQTDTTRSVLEDPLVRPRTALIRSALVPGWGQYSNDRPVKAALFGATAVGFLAAVLVERNNLSRTSDDIRTARNSLADLVAVGGGDSQLQNQITQLEGKFEDQSARQNTRLLYLFATATLAGVDAYVDAHLADFGSFATRLDFETGTAAVFVNLTLRLPFPRSTN
jgi:hypothetical protein